MAEETGRPRLLEADRRQLRWQSVDLEGALPADHRVRLIWATVEALDLGPFEAEILARGSAPGRPAIDPKILLTVWLYAVSEGVGSARHLARLCTRDDAYRWICGGVAPSYHTLSDFRVAHGAKLDALLTQVLAALLSAGIVRLRRVAQDGMRVRAQAGGSSFRRGSKLTGYLAAAEAQVAALRAEVEVAPEAASARERAAQARAAADRAARVRRALQELPAVQRAFARDGRRPQRVQRRRGQEARQEARVSTTDPEARVMRMGDGGYRPAMNVQFATDTDSRLIVGVSVCNTGSDGGQLEPMLAQIATRTGHQPQAYLADGGYAQRTAIDGAAARGVRLYAPARLRRRAAVDPYSPRPTDSAAMAAWRVRMQSAEAKELYKLRAATAETIHADQRTWRGLRQLPVRSLAKALCIALWGALLHNILRADVLLRGSGA